MLIMKESTDRIISCCNEYLLEIPRIIYFNFLWLYFSSKDIEHNDNMKRREMKQNEV